MMLYKILQTVFGLIFRPLFRFEIVGKEYIPDYDGYIICSNHKSNWDPIFLAITFKDQINFMAKSELFKNSLAAKFFNALGVIPVDREGRDLKSLKESVRRLNNGDILGIMPEGTRTKNIDRANMKEGVAYIALKAHANIIPVEIISKFRPLTKTYILIKEPIDVSKYQSMKSKDAMVKITDEIFDNIYENQLELESSNNGN